MLPTAPDAVNLPKPAFFELETTTEEGASACADSDPVSIDEGEESHLSKMAPPYINNQFVVIPGANSVAAGAQTQAHAQAELQSALAQQLQALDLLVQSCNQLFAPVAPPMAPVPMAPVAPPVPAPYGFPAPILGTQPPAQGLGQPPVEVAPGRGPQPSRSKAKGKAKGRDSDAATARGKGKGKLQDSSICPAAKTVAAPRKPSGSGPVWKAKVPKTSESEAFRFQ